MNDDKYQIKTKAKYLKMLLLKDDLTFFHNLLQSEVNDGDSWLAKLRYTRYIFVILNTVLEATNQIKVRGPQEYVVETRHLRKTLAFINHFRNKAVGHLDLALLERAVQWSQSLFIIENNDEIKQSILGQIAIIEACINSYLNDDGIQKVFETEIDLLYPPDYKLFYDYLWTVVTQSIDWISYTLSLISKNIKFHDKDEADEIAAVAGMTNFDLQAEQNINFDPVEAKKAIRNAIIKMKELGVEDKIVEFAENLEKGLFSQ